MRVVSLPCWELFEAQPGEYREDVLPRSVTARLAVEAASPLGWERYVGREGAVIGLERCGASAPGDVVLAELGFTPESVLAHAREVLATGVPDAGGAARRGSARGHAGASRGRSTGTADETSGDGDTRRPARRR